MITWQFKLLGKPEIWHHQEQIEDFNTQKTQALLFFLVAEGGKHNRNHLARFFWDDFNLVSSQNNLRTTLYHLKQDFEPCLVIDRQCVAFSLPESGFLDLALVDTVSTDADIQALSAAAEAYRGNFLAGYSTTIPNFESWKQEKQTYYRQRTIKYLLRLAELHEKEGQTQQCLAAARRILEIDPINEAAILLHMRLLAEMGLHERAIQTYRNYQSSLDNYPDAKPAPKVFDYYTRLKVPLPSQDHNHLPVFHDNFFGRQAEIQQLTRWLTEPKTAWINLTGPSGIGKSRLAIQAAKNVAAHFRDGIQYFDVSGMNADNAYSSIETISKFVLYALQIKLAFGESYQSQLINALKHQEMLIILDNFEPFEWRLNFLKTIFPLPKIKNLVISQEAVDLPGGVTMTLHQGLDFPTEQALPSSFNPELINRYSSLQLFTARAQLVQPGFKIDQKNYRQVAYICRAVQGLPLGIEHIANLLDKSTLDNIAAATLGNTSLDPTLAAQTSLPNKLEMVLDYIWESLAPGTKEATLACSLFKGSFSPADFIAITGETSDRLIALVEASLLYPNAKRKFSLHDLMQAYLDKKLTQAPQQYQQRYSDYYLRSLIRLDKAAQSHPYHIDHYRTEYANLVHACKLALAQGQFTLLTHACGPLSRASAQLGFAETCFTLFEYLAKQLARLPKPSRTAQIAQGHFMQEAANLALKCDQVSPAHTLAKKAAELALTLDNPALLARCWQRLAALNVQSGNPQAAIKFAQDGVTEAVKSGNDSLVASGKITLGQAYFANHQYTQALSAYQTAIDHKLVEDNSRARLAGLMGMVSCLNALGCFNQALAINKKAQRLNNALEDLLTDAFITFSFGEIYKFLGKFEASMSCFAQASTAFFSDNFLSWQSLALANLGLLHFWAGAFTEALHNLEEAEALARENGLSALPEILALKARFLLEADQKEAALDVLQSFNLEKPPLPIITTRINLALAEGDLKTAKNLASRVLPDLKQLNFDSIDDPFSVYLSVYHALKEQDATAAHDILRHARQALTHLHTHLPAEVKVKSLLALPHRRELANIIQEKLEKPAPD